MHAILGGSGNVGVLLSKYIINKGEVVVSVGRTIPENDKLDGCEYKTADYNLVSSIVASIEGAKYVYLLVGLPYNADIWQQQWPQLMENVIEACHQTGAKLIFFDNVYMYGKAPSDGVLTETLGFNPVSKKGEARAGIASYLLSKISEGYLNGLIARCADFYGKNLENSVLGKRFVDQLKLGNLELMGNKDTIHTFTYVNDIPPALYALAHDETNNGETFHLPTTKELLTQYQFGQLFAKHLGIQIKKTTEVKGFTLFIFGFFAPVLKEFKEMMYQFESNYIFNCNKIIERYPTLKITHYDQAIKEILGK